MKKIFCVLAAAAMMVGCGGQKADKAPLTIGVATDGAPNSTWFKIDNFRLYRVEE